MTEHENAMNQDLQGLGPDLVALDAALGELASRDAASARPGFEDRVALATMPHGASGSAGDAAVYWFPGARRDVRFTAMRVAAVVAVAVGGALAWLALRPSSTPVTPIIAGASISKVEQDLSAWLTLTEASAAEFIDLATDSQTIDDSLSFEPAAGAWFLEGESL